MKEYFAHSAPKGTDKNSRKLWQPVSKHLCNVAEMVSGFTEKYHFKNEATIAALLHDIGKYSFNFQKRLEGKASGINHWSAGARIAMEHGAYAAAFAIYGHHVGLPRADKIDPEWFDGEQKLWGITENHEELLKRFQSDHFAIPILNDKERILSASNIAIAFQVATRMLFSCLCDADFLDTEYHFDQLKPANERRQEPKKLNAVAALDQLLSRIEKIAAKKKGTEMVQKVREQILKDCLSAAELDFSNFTLTAPTGSGKTLASLAFALKRCRDKNLERIIIVVPYLSIIEQTAKEFRKVFKSFGDNFILEHHSMADLRTTANVKTADGEDEAERQRRLLCQNWDAPIIVTTSVQFFESLFANTPGACRKLHNIANSVVIFDEAQTFPPHLARPTLATLNALQQDFNITVVFGTATQPAFDGLDENWKPCEIVQDVQGGFRAMSRVNVSLPKPNISLTWEEVANNLLASEKVLCIVNLKRHAQQIIEIMKGKLQKKEHATLFHLSTNMCPAHRQAELKIVRERLEKGCPVRLISTQCIEAGVDIDFPEVWRSLGPLDAIAQAAGRCNREGHLLPQKGQVIVFTTDESLPANMRDYQQAIQQTSITLSNRETFSLEDLAVYREYFKGLYKTRGLDDASQDDWKELIDSYDFPQIHERYKLIDNDTVSVIVPYGDEGTEICNKLEATRFNQNYFKEAQKFMVNLYRSALRNPDFGSHCVQIGKTDLYLWKGPYDELMGLTTGIRFDGIYIA